MKKYYLYTLADNHVKLVQTVETETPLAASLDARDLAAERGRPIMLSKVPPHEGFVVFDFYFPNGTRTRGGLLVAQEYDAESGAWRDCVKK